MKGKVTLNLISLICIILTISACKSKVTRSYLLDSPIYSQELILKWEQKGHRINWSIYHATPANCYSLLVKNNLKVYEHGVVIQQGGKWKPYVFFDRNKQATYSQLIGNERYTIRSRLFDDKKEGHHIRQVVQHPTGEQTVFYIEYDQNWLPVHLKVFHNYQLMTFYVLDTSVLLSNWKSCRKIKPK
jgi:hypothetical protein